MLRKIFTALLVVAALLTTTAAVPGLGENVAVAGDTPNAHPLYPEHFGHVHLHRVFYRTCPYSPWVFYGIYYGRYQAQVAVNYLQACGYDAFCW